MFNEMNSNKKRNMNYKIKIRNNEQKEIIEKYQKQNNEQ